MVILNPFPQKIATCTLIQELQKNKKVILEAELNENIL